MGGQGEEGVGSVAATGVRVDIPDERHRRSPRHPVGSGAGEDLVERDAGEVGSADGSDQPGEPCHPGQRVSGGRSKSLS